MKIFKTYCLLIFSLFISHLFSSAQTNIDSLKTRLNTFGNDKASIHQILAIAESYGNLDLNAQIVTLEIAEEKTYELKDPILLCSIYIKLGNAYIESSKTVEASGYLLKAKRIAEYLQNEDLLIELHRNLGLLYYINKEFNKALEEFRLVEKNAVKPEHLSSKQAVLINMAGIYYQTSNGSPEKLLESMRLLKAGLQIAIQLNDTKQVFEQYCNLGLLYCEMNEVDSAQHYLDKAGTILADTSNTEMLMTYNSNTGRLYFQKGQYNKAIEHMQLTIQYALQINLPEWVYESYAGLSTIYEAKGDYINALKYYRESSDFKDSVISQENFAKAADIQNKYEREKKEKELITLQKDNEIKEIQMTIINHKRGKIRSTLFIMIGVLGVLSVLLVLLLTNIQSKRRAFKALQVKNEQIRTQSIELSQQAKTIAKFQSQMNPHFVFNALNSIQGLVIADENEKATFQIQSLAQLMRKTFSNAEKEDITLQEEISYLKNYINFETQTSGIHIDFNIDIAPTLEDILLPPMMIQPFVENAIKHARLETVKDPLILVKIETEIQLLSVSIIDNGVGFKKQAGEKDPISHSTSVVASRIQILFQKNNIPAPSPLIVIKSVPEISSGTHVKFYLPLNYSF